MSVKILIADDHPLFRAAMCHALASVEHIELVETSTFPDTLTSLEENDDIETGYGQEKGSHLWWSRRIAFIH